MFLILAPKAKFLKFISFIFRYFSGVILRGFSLIFSLRPVPGVRNIIYLLNDPKFLTKIEIFDREFNNFILV